MEKQISKMPVEEIESRLKKIHPALPQENPHLNRLIYGKLLEHTQKKIIPEALNKKEVKRIGGWWSEERPVKGKLNIDERLRKDLKNGKIKFSFLPKKTQETLEKRLSEKSFKEKLLRFVKK
jgi:hypothetical protein